MVNMKRKSETTRAVSGLENSDIFPSRRVCSVEKDRLAGKVKRKSETFGRQITRIPIN